MTRDELQDLACLGFSADLTMQSFAIPRPIQSPSTSTRSTRCRFHYDPGGVSLRPGDGIIHSWLNRMLLPDTVGTGVTPIPASRWVFHFRGLWLSGLCCATGVMPLDMPESCWCASRARCSGRDLEDLVHAIPYYAIQQGLLTVEKKARKHILRTDS
ncbi:MAG: hypothetical protein CM15mP89_5760 [Gammaproteobacteria bacterium]|nr:MAG: hypothetical protein CM15mP89_5760 [Gammaproteobacteria bacterium]